MAYKVYNSKTRKHAITPGSDATGPFIQYENGIKEYFLTIALTDDTTVTTLPAGLNYARTTHATGRGKLFVSDGAKWQEV